MLLFVIPFFWSCISNYEMNIHAATYLIHSDYSYRSQDLIWPHGSREVANRASPWLGRLWHVSSVHFAMYHFNHEICWKLSWKIDTVSALGRSRHSFCFALPLQQICELCVAVLLFTWQLFHGRSCDNIDWRKLRGGRISNLLKFPKFLKYKLLRSKSYLNPIYSGVVLWKKMPCRKTWAKTFWLRRCQESIPGPLACQATVEVSRPDFMGLGLFSVSSLKGLGLVSVSTFKGLGVETTLSRLQGMKKHSVGGRFQYPQWKNDVFGVNKYSQWKQLCFLCRKIFDKTNIGSQLGLGLGLRF